MALLAVKKAAPGYWEYIRSRGWGAEKAFNEVKVVGLDYFSRQCGHMRGHLEVIGLGFGAYGDFLFCFSSVHKNISADRNYKAIL